MIKVVLRKYAVLRILTKARDYFVFFLEIIYLIWYNTYNLNFQAVRREQKFGLFFRKDVKEEREWKNRETNGVVDLVLF